jgi:hypothetical protein
VFKKMSTGKYNSDYQRLEREGAGIGIIEG